MNRLKDRVAVVTGSGRGLGAAMVKLMAEEDAKVIVNDPGVNIDGTGFDRGPADEVVAAIRKAGGTAIANYDSIATVDGGENIIRAALDNFGRIDILVNNGFILRDRMIFNMTEEEWGTVIATDLKGTYTCTKPAAIMMRQQRYGRIVNVSSTTGTVGNSGQANYGAAKAAQVGFTRAIGRDLGRYGITCNAIAPEGYSRIHEMLAAMPNRTKKADFDIQVDDMTLKDMLTPPEMAIAPLVTYLCSEAAWNINGQLFQVYAGVIALCNYPSEYRTIHSDGIWSLDELGAIAPKLMKGTSNPAPPANDVDVPGRAKQPSV